MQPNMQLNTVSSTQSLESRVAQLESVLKTGNKPITLQVGTSKIVISPDKIELVCRGTINITAGKLNLTSQTDIETRADANISERASSTISIQASGTLSLKGATINQN